MASESRVIVVGTTPDYVRWIGERWPGRALFLTDATLRQRSVESPPAEADEATADLKKFRQARQALEAHMRRFDIRPSGLTCYDCESMPLAAALADACGLPYHSARSIELCRDKARCKSAWQGASVPCPASTVVADVEQALAFFRSTGGWCVYKPLTGTGSELVFLCTTEHEVREAVEEIQAGMDARRHGRLYAGVGRRLAAEQYVPGPEYSCDFLVDDGRVRILRLSRKILMEGGPFGIIRGYVLPASLPAGHSLSALSEIFARAAGSLGLTRAMCMVDFIASADGPKLLELAPRPGGDCLPQVIRHAGGPDMLGAALSFAEGWPLEIGDYAAWSDTVGLRIYAECDGVLDGVDFSGLLGDPRVLETRLQSAEGDRIVLPPNDYDSWVLGHVIFRPDPTGDLHAQCDEMLAKVRIHMKHSESPVLSLTA